MRRQRQWVTYAVICKGLTALHQPVGVSLSDRSATPSAHTLGPPIGPFGPKISPVSDSQPLRVISRWLLLPGSTAHQYFQQWVDDGVFDNLWQPAFTEYNELIGLDWT